jgi:hypothetical protein
LQYSTDGITFTSAAPTVTVPSVTPWVVGSFDLSSVLALNNSAGVYFRILGSGGTGAAGTWRIDNFQVQAQTDVDITTANIMPNGFIGIAYSTPMAATGGVGPYTFAVSGGAAPTGLTLNPAGTWAGLPTTAGLYNFEVTATDSNPFAFQLDGFDSKFNRFVPNVANTRTEAFQITILAPTAATATVRGRVVSETGRGLSRAVIAVLDAQTGVTVYARTNQLGYFTIADLQIGDFYILQIQRKGYEFSGTTSFQLFENLDDLIITGTPNQ